LKNQTARSLERGQWPSHGSSVKIRYHIAKDVGTKKERRPFALQAESMSQAFESACEPHRANMAGVRVHDLLRDQSAVRKKAGRRAGGCHKPMDTLQRFKHVLAEDSAENKNNEL
jgi:hypothetical protein